jgi:undecaprenyl-diphosphatase
VQGDATDTLTGLQPDHAVAVFFIRLSRDQPWLIDVGEVLAYVLHPWTFRVAVLLACAAVWAAGRRRAAVVGAVALAAGSLLGVGLKLLIQRPRPAWGQPVAVEVGYSMPSGHALNAALGCGLLLVLGWAWLARRGLRAPAVAAAVVVVLAAALDRLVLGVHYLTDVTAGVAVGLAVALLAARFGAAPPAGRQPEAGPVERAR